MYVHHQVIEGLSVTAGENLPRLVEFEKRKLNEVFFHYRNVRKNPTNLKRFR